MKSKTKFLLFTLLSIPFTAAANEGPAPITSWEWRPLSESATLAESAKVFGESSPKDATPVLFENSELEDLWVLGEKIYKVVENGKPVLNINTQNWSVLPRNVKEARDLTEWKDPVRIGYVLKAKNLYGMEVINVRYLVQFVPGGKLDGKGAYLAHITVIPSTAEVAWGYTLNIEASAREALNVGTTEDPVAAFSTDVRVQVKTLLKESVSTLTTFMTGEGKVLPAGFSTAELR
jgi:hypothetical protein